MPDQNETERWRIEIRERYKNYLQTSFYFKDPTLRESFSQALEEYDLMGEVLPEPARNFILGANADDLAAEYFKDKVAGLSPALLNQKPLYHHQEEAIRLVHGEGENIVVATGTASGKTESFLYPILFELYRQHLSGELQEPGVRALILYPMNALANDQRRRLGEICGKLKKKHSDFKPTFGQYIGETPENENDRIRNAERRKNERLPNELIFREEMREKPPHILLTNYSMLEYLLIRPQDSELFDGDSGRHWRFIVLDEAHQYRGAKGMEMGMLIRRLKQRLHRSEHNNKPFCCIATSATISSSENEESEQAVARFAGELFGEKENFSAKNVIFGERKLPNKSSQPQRFHLFLRALEGAFIVHENNMDKIVLNRETANGDENSNPAKPLEIALCGECGQHYYVGRLNCESIADEAIRDPSQEGFGVDFYLPLSKESSDVAHGQLCRCCGNISHGSPECECDASIPVRKCEVHKNHGDQLKECAACGYQRGAIGDPVREIVHGSDGPNVVIATALHGLLPKDRRKILAFADSRQEAAFFAWYAEDSYGKLRDRNLILRAFKGADGNEALSLDDLAESLRKTCEANKFFRASDTKVTKKRKIYEMICREIISDQPRISLEGVGLIKWFVEIPEEFQLPQEIFSTPWSFQKNEAESLIAILLDSLRARRAVTFPQDPDWNNISPYSPQSVCRKKPQRRQNAFSWSSSQRAIVGHFLARLLPDNLEEDKRNEEAEKLMLKIWDQIREYDDKTEEESRLLKRSDNSGLFQLNLAWLRAKVLQAHDELFKCGICARLHFHNIRGVCQRNKCPGHLSPVKVKDLPPNHYQTLYEDAEMPATFCAEEHTAQLQSEKARERQEDFKDGKINLLSSSTTFEVGVDLGDLEVVFLRNVPPEPFNYTQRAGRAGRREVPGLALTYCRRNPHDLYHYFNPEKRILEGVIHTPQLSLRNEKIISRHIVATALSAFFRTNPGRFQNVEDLIGEDWENPQGAAAFKRYCEVNRESLEKSLNVIVPQKMHNETGLDSQASWIEKVAGEKSRLAIAESSVCDDYQHMDRLEKEACDANDYKKAGKAKERKRTIATEKALNFLSRYAIIPKYGFPVDVVELDTRPSGQTEVTNISLQRDLSQAIAEFAPGGKVVANKKEWESYGVKTIQGRGLKVWHYERDNQRNFRQWSEGDTSAPIGKRKYLWPQFGFVTKLFKKPSEPKGRARRLYTTRPYFGGFVNDSHPGTNTQNFFGVEITQALPGRMVVLCEGKHGAGFYICRTCGAGFPDKQGAPHKSPIDTNCNATLERLSLGHEFVTDVTRLHFPTVTSEWGAYSLAYAVLLGTASTLNVPDTDLNATITGQKSGEELSIVLYDNVPGGAGLVANLEKKDVFKSILLKAKERVEGNCGCGPSESCYGCLRSYRNQFAHPHLQREFALHILEEALAKA